MYTETWASDSGESYEIVFLSSEISVCIEIWTQGGKNGGLSWPRLGLVTSLAPAGCIVICAAVAKNLEKLLPAPKF